jgi:cytochrome P450
MQSVPLDLELSDNPVELLSQTLAAAGGVIKTRNSAGVEIVYFHPDAEWLAAFHASERSGALVNHNTPAIEDLFAGTVFVLSGRTHIEARKRLFRFFGSHDRWQDEVAFIVDSWARRATEARKIDILEQTRMLAVGIFTKVALGLNPASEDGEHVAKVVWEFVRGAVEASSASPDLTALRRALVARDELFRLTLEAGAESGPSFASHCLQQYPSQEGIRDIASVLIASVETTANMLAWTIARWALAPAPEREDVEGFARRIEALDSPNTIIMRRATAPMFFHGISLKPGTLLAYSPAADRGNGPGVTDDQVTFGSGSRSCPGRSMARYIVRCTLRALAAQSAPWTIVDGVLPRPIAWFPVRTFGLGINLRTSA